MYFINPLEISSDCLQLYSKTPITRNSETVFPNHRNQSTSIILKDLFKKFTKNWKKYTILSDIKFDLRKQLGFITVLSIKRKKKIVQFIERRKKKKNLPTLESDFRETNRSFSQSAFANEERLSFWWLEEHFNCARTLMLNFWGFKLRRV